MAPRILHQLRRGVEAHRLAVEQRADEGRRVVAFEPGGGVGQQREAGGMRFGKAVAGEAFQLAEQALRELVAVAVGAQAVDQPGLEGADVAIAPPGRHGAAQAVGLLGGKARRHHHQFHGLLLEDRHAEGPLQHLFHFR